MHKLVLSAYLFINLSFVLHVYRAICATASNGFGVTETVLSFFELLFLNLNEIIWQSSSCIVEKSPHDVRLKCK